MKPLTQLLEMLTYARPCGGTTERAFIRRFIATLPDAWQDDNENWHVHVSDDPILWSCHTDTVHRKDGRQTVSYDPRTGLVGLSRKSKRTASCLGADDTAGVWLAVQMIGRKVPGHYVFHFGEEVGGLGSGQLAADYADWLGSFHCAIALDRGGDHDVITHQAGRMTASVGFAESLACILNADSPFLYEPCDRGIYTDTAEYSDAIAECTNVSVGYAHAHSDRETLDCTHLLALLDRLCMVRIGDLAIVRTPGQDDRPIGRLFDWSDWPIDVDDPIVDVHPTADTPSDDEQPETIGDWYLDNVYRDVQAALRRWQQ